MPHTSRPSSRCPLRRVALILIAACLAVFTGRPQAAAPTELFFSEYVEGTSNNKALEIYNGTGAAVDLGAGGYNIQMFFNGNSASTLTITLAGTVANGDVFVVVQSLAGPTLLALADQTNSAGWFNGNDAVVLRKGTTVIDVFGQVGVNPTEWGTGLTSSADNTLRRKAAVCAGDAISNDTFDPSVEWDGFATDTFDGLGSHTETCSGGGDTAPGVSATTPGNGATGVALNANLSVTFSEAVNVTGAWFTLSCSVSGPHTAAVSGGPTTFTLNPDTDFAYGEACTLTIAGAQVSDQDTSDPPDTMAADVVVSFNTPSDPCVTFTPIYSIQGGGASAAITGAVVTRGVVVGDYEGPSPTLRGFYIQDPLGDGSAATSDAIFVFNGSNNSVSLGDIVGVAGSVSEFQEQTQISASSIVSCGTGSVTPVDVTLPVAAADEFERYEGMLVRLPQTLTVTEHFQLGRFGQVVVSSGGRLRQPTDVVAPGPAAQALQAANDLDRLIIDDATNQQNADPILFGRNGQPLSASNTLRAGDTASSTVGVMTYTWAGNAASGNAYRVRPVGALGGFVDFEAANPRPTGPPAVPAGVLRVASMNVLNFFNTVDGLPDTVDNCANGVGGTPTDCRGADTAAELDRQWPKTVAAIAGSGADVIALSELENDGYGPASAIQFLVDRLNEATAPGTYAFIDADAATGTTNALGTDAIKVGILYKPARALPVGQTAALNSSALVNGGDSEPRNRPALAQAFEAVDSGARFVLSANHFKSKGSACDAPDAGDGQGNCNEVRRQAAAALIAWLAADPTGVNDPDVLIVGDLNSYSKEDPVTEILAAGYLSLLPAFGGGFSYVFDGQWGSLDHALATESLAPQVLDAADWYINADEPSVLDYNTDFKSVGQQTSLYSPDEFRMADHNPLVIDLALADQSARVSGGGGLLLTNPAGVGAGDQGSTATFALNAQFKTGTTIPGGQANVLIRRTEGGELRTYQVKTTALTTLVRDVATGEGTVVGLATIADVTDPSAPVVIDAAATLRVVVRDAGEPGVGADTVAITVRTNDGTLWFASRWNGSATVAQTIAQGNVQVR